MMLVYFLALNLKSKTIGNFKNCNDQYIHIIVDETYEYIHFGNSTISKTFQFLFK